MQAYKGIDHGFLELVELPRLLEVTEDVLVGENLKAELGEASASHSPCFRYRCCWT